MFYSCVLFIITFNNNKNTFKPAFQVGYQVLTLRCCHSCYWSCFLSLVSVINVFTSCKWLTNEISPICLDPKLLARKKSHLIEFLCGSLCPLCPKQNCFITVLFSLPALLRKPITFTREFIIQYKYHIQPRSSCFTSRISSQHSQASCSHVMSEPHVVFKTNTSPAVHSPL